MSTATLIVALASQPAGIQLAGKEALEVFSATCGRDPANVLIQCHATSAAGAFLAQKSSGDLLIISGDLLLNEDGNTPILYARTMCCAFPEQYINEVVLVGRIAGDPKTTDSAKSCSRNLAVNRYSCGQESTDWFKVRAFGFSKDRLESVVKGTLVSISGILDQRTNRDGAPYPEIKVRSLKLHGKPKGGGTADPSAGKAAGYSQEDFASKDIPWDWSN